MPTPTRPARRRQLVSLGLVAAVVGGIAFRFATTSPLWLDEALSVRIAELPLGDIGDALRRDGHPPLYYWLLHGWMGLFGHGDAAVRALSGLFAVLSLPLAWRLGDRVGGPRVARWSLVLLAVSPFAVRYGTEARMYSLVSLLALLLVFALDRSLRRPGVPSAVLLALVSGALLWTHYWSLYLLGVVGILLLVRWRLRPDRRGATSWTIAGVTGGAVLFLPWVPALLDQLQHTGTPWAKPSRPTQVGAAVLTDLGGGGYAEAILIGALLAVFVVAAFAQLDRAPSTTSDTEPSPFDVRVLAGVAGATLLLGSSLAFAIGGAFASRYGAVVVPYVLVAAAVGITRLRPTWLQVALVGSLLALSAASLAHNVVAQRTRADDVATAIVAGARPGDLVVVCPDQLGPGLTRALDHRGSDLEVVRYRDLGDARFVDWTDYGERNDETDPRAVAQRVLQRAAGAPIWVVWTGGYRTLIGDCEELLLGIEEERGESTTVTYGAAFEVANLIRYP